MHTTLQRILEEEMNTREIAKKLWAYAELLDAEKSRAMAIFRITNDDALENIFARPDAEIEEVRTMANELWDKKESI